MKKTKHKTSKKTYFIVVLCVLVMVAVGLSYANRTKVKNFFTKNDETPTASENLDESAEVNKIDYSPSSPTDNEDINKQKENIEPPTPPTSPSLNATITYAAQNSDTSVIVRVLIEGTTSGQCRLILTNSSSKIEKTAPVILRGNNYTCDGFTINKSELATGEWKASVTVEANGMSSDAGETTVTIV